MIAIIGGTGVELGARADLTVHFDEIVGTRWGNALVTRATLDGQEILFLHRHADPLTKNRSVPPHKINYRANIAALKKLGVTTIYASTAVGSLHEEWPAGTFVLLSDFMDFSGPRAKTFFDERAVHVDVTQPYCPHARAQLSQAAAKLGLPLCDGGTYFCAEGPRFETPAEIRTYKSWGGDVVGMTGVPEVTLAREAEISYAGVSVVTNLAAGISPQWLSHQEVVDAMKVSLPRVVDLFLEAARGYTDDPSIDSRRATRGASSPEFDPQSCVV